MVHENGALRRRENGSHTTSHTPPPRRSETPPSLRSSSKHRQQNSYHTSDSKTPAKRCSPFVSRQKSDGRAIVERGHAISPTHSSALYNQLLHHETMIEGGVPLSPSSTGSIRVRVHRCHDAFTHEEMIRTSSSFTGYGSSTRQYVLYVVVHNETDRGQTSPVECQIDPSFNEEFLLHSDSPMKDALVVTLVRRAKSGGSSSGKDQKVAECCLSLETLIWKKDRTYWVPLVRKAGSAEAVEQGEVQISLYSEDYGLDCAPVSPEEELAFYRDVHSVLLRRSPEELHRVHWMVGHYLRKPQRWAQRRETRYTKKDGDSNEGGHHPSRQPQQVSDHDSQRWSRAGLRANGVKVNLIVKEVDGLVTETGSPSPSETCCVTVSSASSCDTSRTSTEVYLRRAVFQQLFKVTLRSPEDAVRFSVISADTTVGECSLGLFNIKAGRPSSLVLPLVTTSSPAVVPFGSCRADEEVASISITGYLHVTVCAESHSTSLHYSGRQAELLHQRVLAFLWCQQRAELYQLYPILSRLQGVEQGMAELVANAGEEPIPIRVQLRLQEFRRLTGRLSNADVPCHIEVMVGPYRYRTRTVTTRGSSLLPIKETIEMTVLSPSTTPCTLILVEERGSRRGEEVSRVTFGFSRLIIGQAQSRQLRLTHDAFTPEASLHEEVLFELFTDDSFGWDAGILTPQAVTSDVVCLGHMEGLLRRQSPGEMHLARYWLDCIPFGREDYIMNQLNEKYGDGIEAAPMTVQILGIKNFRHDGQVKVKVEMNDKVLIQTKTKSKGSWISFTLDDNNEAVTTLHHAYQSSLKVTIINPSTFSEGEALGHLEVSMRHLIRGEQNIIWLPVYTEDVVAGSIQKGEYKASHVVPLGFLGLALQSMAFPRFTVIEYPSREDAPLRPEEEVYRDVATLLLKYRRSELPRLHSLVAEYPRLDLAHAAIRKRLCGEVGATVYLTIDAIHLNEQSARDQEEENIDVEITYGKEMHVSDCMTEKLVDLPQRRFYPVVRLDIPPLPSSSSQGSVSSASVFGRGNHSMRKAAMESRHSRNHIPFLCPPLTITLVKGGKGRQHKMVRQTDKEVPSNSQTEPVHTSTAITTTTSVVPSRDTSYIAASVQTRPTPRNTSATLERDMNRLDSYRVSPAAESRQMSPNVSAITPVDPGVARMVAHHPSVVAPPRPGVLSEVYLSIRALLTPSLYRMGERVTLPLVRMQPPSGVKQQHVTSPDGVEHLLGTITFHVQPAAFDRNSDSFSLDRPVPRTAGLSLSASTRRRADDGSLDAPTIQYYGRRVMNHLERTGSDALMDFHYQLYEGHVASGMWEQSLPAWSHATKPSPCRRL